MQCNIVLTKKKSKTKKRKQEKIDEKSKTPNFHYKSIYSFSSITSNSKTHSAISSLAKQLAQSNLNSKQLLCKCLAIQCRSLFRTRRLQRCVPWYFRLIRFAADHLNRLGMRHSLHLDHMHSTDLHLNHREDFFDLQLHCNLKVFDCRGTAAPMSHSFLVKSMIFVFLNEKRRINKMELKMHRK